MGPRDVGCAGSDTTGDVFSTGGRVAQGDFAADCWTVGFAALEGFSGALPLLRIMPLPLGSPCRCCGAAVGGAGAVDGGGGGGGVWVLELTGSGAVGGAASSV